jgi:hypothetical protein
LACRIAVHVIDLGIHAMTRPIEGYYINKRSIYNIWALENRNIDISRDTPDGRIKLDICTYETEHSADLKVLVLDCKHWRHKLNCGT